MPNVKVLRLRAQRKGLEDAVSLSAILPHDRMAPSEEEMNALLRHVSLDPQLHLYRFDAAYSFVDDDRPDPASFSRNTAVAVSLPYCLHVPSGLELELPMPDGSGNAVVMFRKIWTNAASGSTEADLYADDRLTYSM